MNTRTRFLLALVAVSMALLSFAATAGPGEPMTRTLQQTVNVPDGDSVAVENLAGHMRVIPGNGPLRVEATVVAGGSAADSLAQSVKLDVTTVGKQVQIHVYYPVDRYDTYVFRPPGSQAQNDYDDVCLLGNYFCFQGQATFPYQGKRVRVVQANHRGAVPLYVDVVVFLPAHIAASFENDAGLLEANGLTSDISMLTRSGDIHVGNQTGTLNATSHGGDVHLTGVTSSDLRILTSGGDIKGSHLSGDMTLQTDGGDAGLNTLSGNITVVSGGGRVAMTGDLSTLKTLHATTDGGDFVATGALAALTSADIKSDGGDIVFRARNLSLHLDATSSGGHIRVDVPTMSCARQSTYHWSCDIGKGAGSGTLQSDGGDITVAQR